MAHTRQQFVLGSSHAVTRVPLGFVFRLVAAGVLLVACSSAKTPNEAVRNDSLGAAGHASPSGSASAQSVEAGAPCADAIEFLACKAGYVVPGTISPCFSTAEAACRCACKDSRYISCKATGSQSDGPVAPVVVCE